jgi:transposase
MIRRGGRTIPGIGLQTAAALVAKIVSIERFATPTALIGYFGVFLEEVDVSGTTKTRTSRTPIRSSGKANRPEPTLPA